MFLYNISHFSVCTNSTAFSKEFSGNILKTKGTKVFSSRGSETVPQLWSAVLSDTGVIH